MNEETCCHGCCTRHHCEPPDYPTALGQHWTCPECGRLHRPFDVHAEAGDVSPVVLKHVPPGTLGWTTRQPANPKDQS